MVAAGVDVDGNAKPEMAAAGEEVGVEVTDGAGAVAGVIEGGAEVKKEEGVVAAGGREGVVAEVVVGAAGGLNRDEAGFAEDGGAAALVKLNAG